MNGRLSKTIPPGDRKYVLITSPRSFVARGPSGGIPIKSVHADAFSCVSCFEADHFNFNAFGGGIGKGAVFNREVQRDRDRKLKAVFVV